MLGRAVGSVARVLTGGAGRLTSGGGGKYRGFGTRKDMESLKAIEAWTVAEVGKTKK